MHSFGKSYNYNDIRDRKQHLIDGNYKCTRLTANEAVAEYFKRFKVIKQDNGKFHVCGILHTKMEHHYYYYNNGVDCQTEEEGQSLIRDQLKYTLDYAQNQAQNMTSNDRRRLMSENRYNKRFPREYDMLLIYHYDAIIAKLNGMFNDSIDQWPIVQDNGLDHGVDVDECIEVESNFDANEVIEQPIEQPMEHKNNVPVESDLKESHVYDIMASVDNAKSPEIEQPKRKTRKPKKLYINLHYGRSLDYGISLTPDELDFNDNDDMMNLLLMMIMVLNTCFQKLALKNHHLKYKRQLITVMNHH